MSTSTRHESRTALFLDFDGVLHPERPSAEGLDFFCRMPVLEHLLFECPSLRVVVSSSWRERFSIRELREFFPAAVQSRVVGRTPIRLPASAVPDQLIGYLREAECMLWMRRRAKHAGIEDSPIAWIALDDQPWRFSPHCRNLVVTDSRIGLTLANTAEIVAKVRSSDLVVTGLNEHARAVVEFATDLADGDVARAKVWFYSAKLAPFGGATAAELVEIGRSADVLAYLESIEGGAAG